MANPESGSLEASLQQRLQTCLQANQAELDLPLPRQVVSSEYERLDTDEIQDLLQYPAAQDRSQQEFDYNVRQLLQRSQIAFLVHSEPEVIFSKARLQDSHSNLECEIVLNFADGDCIIYLADQLRGFRVLRREVDACFAANRVITSNASKNSQVLKKIEPDSLFEINNSLESYLNIPC